MTTVSKSFLVVSLLVHSVTGLSFALRDAALAGIRIGAATNPDMGKGGFATDAIPCFTKIGSYKGELLTEDEALLRYKRGKHKEGKGDKEWEESRKERKQTLTGTYLFNVGDHAGTVIDAEDTDISGWCRFMNHASEDDPECNVKAFNRQTTAGELTHPIFYAIRDIEAGEELMYDYGSSWGVFS